MENYTHIQLAKPTKILYGPANQAVPVMGEFKLGLSKQEAQQIFVVKGLRNNLLGLPAIERLGLVVQVNAISGDLQPT